MSFKTSDEENGEQNTRCVRISIDVTIVLTFTRVALSSLRAVRVGRKLECFEGPTSRFSQAFCHPAHHPHGLSPQSWEVGADIDRIPSEVTFLICSAIPSLSQTRKTAEPEVSGIGYGVLDPLRANNYKMKIVPLKVHLVLGVSVCVCVCVCVCREGGLTFSK